MATEGGPKLVNDGLVLALDAANPRGISPAANEVFNNSDQFVKNLSDISSTISANNGVKIGNLNYYTAFAINFRESDYGGSAAARDGITPGFNTTSGTKLFEYGRALHFHIWDDSAGGFISNSNFNGEGSFRYDSWSGNSNASTEVAQFITDYNNLKLIYPNDTYIIAGSHRDSFHTTAKLDILRDLGAPNNVDSLVDGAPEYILVGKPGLGAGNAYVWSFENYSTDPTQVAHAVFPLPINKVNERNYFKFDGTNESIDIAENSNLNNLSYTYAFWIKRKVGQSSSFLQFLQRSTSDRNPGIWFYKNEIDRIHFSIKLTNGTNVSVNPRGFSQNEWYYFTGSVEYNGTDTLIKGYKDGILVDQTQLSNVAPILGTGNSYIGRQLMDISNLQIYNRALTNSEVLQNYNATKSRFGL